ncbi:MAG: hypothetical protein V5783_07050 [Pontiella sp.]
METPYHLLILMLLFWAGFVSAISFFEAWLKFRADGITLQTGLRIGKLIFSSLNKVEIVFLILVWMLVFFMTGTLPLHVSLINALLWLISSIVIVQTIWLTPKLTKRAVQIIEGHRPPPSKLHLLFIFLELAKVAALLAFYVALQPSAPEMIP